MSGISTNEDSTVPKSIGHEGSADPIFSGHHLVLKIGVNAKNCSDGPVAIDRIKAGFTPVEIVVNEPYLLTIDGDCCATAPRVE